MSAVVVGISDERGEIYGLPIADIPLLLLEQTDTQLKNLHVGLGCLHMLQESGGVDCDPCPVKIRQRLGGGYVPGIPASLRSASMRSSSVRTSSSLLMFSEASR